MTERCVCCGEEIPEGRMICPQCENGRKKRIRKERITYYLKWFLLVFPPMMGYLFMYCIVWLKLGFSLDRWMMLMLIAVAGLSEWAFLNWVTRWE